MKQIGLFFFAALIGSGILAQPWETHLKQLEKSEKWVYKTEGADPIHLANTGNYDVVYHRLELVIDPAVRAIAGSVTTYFKPMQPLTQIAFDLSDSLTVTQVSYHGTVLPFLHQNDALTITLPATIQQLDSISITYQGVPPNSGFGSFVQDFHGDSVPVLWTLSEPYGARDWWPCKNTLQDKVDSLDLWIAVPEGNRAAGNGLLIDEIHNGGTAVFHWKHRYPIATYLVATAVTNYDQYTDTIVTTAGPITSLNYCYPENKTEWMASSTNTAKCMQLYTRLFGAYPFIREKYGHAQFNWGGGQEHQTMSFQVSLDFELDAHELAHQWFGDKLTCNSWADIWLNEGFATYASGLCYENFAPQYWRAFLETRRKEIFRVDSGSVFCTDTANVSRIFDGALSYSKGAYLLHMLRFICGDKAFFKGILNYVQDPALIYNFSRTKLLQQHLEATSNLDLSVFFREWFVGSGYPSFDLQWKKRGGLIVANLWQTTSDKKVPFFHMPVMLRVYYDHGNFYDFTVQHHYTGEEFLLHFDAIVDSIVIDPDLWIISKNNKVRKVGEPSEQFVSIYPDPFSNVFTIWYDAENLHRPRFELYDAKGRKVLGGEIDPNADRYEVKTETLQPGVYTLQFYSSEKKKALEVVKISTR
ncbi:MAG: M1 family aminopeptidase [Chitinophagales bacterium]